jgi:hypothetical protein
MTEPTLTDSLEYQYVIAFTAIETELPLVTHRRAGRITHRVRDLL